MNGATPPWWDRLAIQRKVWVVLLIVVVPMVAILAVHATLIRSLLETQHERHRVLLAREQTQELRRLAIDIEDAFRGYLLTRNRTFLDPLREAEGKLDPALVRARQLVAGIPGVSGDLTDIGNRMHSLLASKHLLLDKVERGSLDEVLEYVRSGKGLQLSDQIRSDLRNIEDGLDRHLERLDLDIEASSTRAFWGLVAAVGVGLILGGFGVRQLARSLTGPLELIRNTLLQFARDGDGAVARGLNAVTSSDEIGQLARSCEEMVRRISADIQELQLLHSVSLQISTISQGGIDSVLQQIADMAVSPMRADVCVVLSRNESMGCWIVEAASGDFADRLRKTVMLWEELPISVQAFETRRPAIGEELRKDTRPEMVRRNLIGDSMLAVPLLSRGASCGVIAFLSEQAIPAGTWNVRMAESLAGAAASAIDNARMYDAVHQKEQRTRKRLRQLEHLGESIAHDLKGPAERMGGLSGLLRKELELQGNPRAEKLLNLIEQNGTELGRRVEQILSLARVGGRQETLEPVDPSLVLDDIVKARANELETARVRVIRKPGLPPVACHRAYLYQILDNLISNAVKFSRGSQDPTIIVSAECIDNRAVFAVTDNGPGIPPAHRERVFDPFVRLNPAKEDGTGIGLAIVRRIVELYDGRIWVEDVEGRGCRVRFTLPLLAALRVPENPPPATKVHVLDALEPLREES